MKDRVRAKFICTRKLEDQSGVGVGLEAVTGGSEENERFFRYTPSGSIAISVVRGEVAAGFVVGATYYVDFTMAEGPAQK